MENGNTRTVLMTDSSLRGWGFRTGAGKEPGDTRWGWPSQGPGTRPAPRALVPFPAVVFTGRVINGRLTVTAGGRLPALIWPGACWDRALPGTVTAQG